MLFKKINNRLNLYMKKHEKGRSLATNDLKKKASKFLFIARFIGLHTISHYIFSSACRSKIQTEVIRDLHTYNI